MNNPRINSKHVRDNLQAIIIRDEEEMNSGKKEFMEMNYDNSFIYINREEKKEHIAQMQKDVDDYDNFMAEDKRKCMVMGICIFIGIIIGIGFNSGL